jgi:two-component system, NtrC family, response regulator AtoC
LNPADKIVSIKIYSDIEDRSSVISAVKQLELKGVEISLSMPRKVEVSENEILILQIEDINSKYFNKILDIKSSIRNKIIFIAKNDAVLVSSLAKLGFQDVFVLPYELYRLTSYLFEVINNRSYITQRVAQSVDGLSLRSIIGESYEFRKIINLARKVSEKSDVNIIILGETGTGKGLLAKAIHNNSPNRDNPFVDIICTAIPEALLESELFGYEPGAFTNAKTRKFGLFELAEKGSIFLDEIGDLSMNIQSKLLRTIEKKLIRRLGGILDIPINARIISATNKNLEVLIENNLFRRDLYHRLNVVSLELPPLRHRKEDIPGLAEYFIAEYNRQFDKKIKKMEKDLRDFLVNYPWPGNVRELKNSIERGVLLSEDSTLRLKHFSNLFTNIHQKSSAKVDELLPFIIRMDLNYSNTDLRKSGAIYANEILKKLHGNKSQTAKLLGISRPKLDMLLKTSDR